MDKLSGTSHLQWYHPANLKPWNKVKANAHFSSQMAPLCELLREYLCATLLQSCCVIVYAANCAQSWLLVKLPTSVNCTHGETQSKARLLYNSNTIDLYTYTTHSAHHKYKTWWHLHRHNDRRNINNVALGGLPGRVEIDGGSQRRVLPGSTRTSSVLPPGQQPFITAMCCPGLRVLYNVRCSRCMHVAIYTWAVSWIPSTVKRTSGSLSIVLNAQPHLSMRQGRPTTGVQGPRSPLQTQQVTQCNW